MRESASRGRKHLRHPMRQAGELLVWAAAVLVSACTAAGTAPPPGPSGDASGEWPLYGNLGPHQRPLTTTSETAEAYFHEGVQFMYAFGVGSAARSFREAQEHDARCALCYWGEAWALGPYLNDSRVPPEREREAHRAARRARDLASNGMPVERALTDAMLVRYSDSPGEEGRLARDSAYAEAMGDVVQRHPEDLDAATLWAEALMLLRPRRGTWNKDDPSVQEIYRVLESVLARDIRHPGACHLYIHATESGTEPGRAEACAEHLGNAIPGASHINHMPSHTFNRIGRWADAVRANQQAWHTDQRAAYGGPPGIYPTHNLHMLLFAASFGGQGAAAMQAARDLAQTRGGAWFYVPLTAVRFGRWQSILELDEPESTLDRGMWTFARGMAQLRYGNAALANERLADLDEILVEVGDSDQFRGHRLSDLIGINRAILAGEIAASSGQLDRAIEILEAALPMEDGLRYDEPEPLLNPIRHHLGALLIEVGRHADAAARYREELDDHPHNGWSLFGLAEALDALGESGSAALARQELARSWADADHWLRSSRY